ncbi:MAG: type IV secretory pathway VirB2 component (pilin) [Rickettsiales bacterium]|jgi:type IV secretory pathway VirB2 component (pilin)
MKKILLSLIFLFLISIAPVSSAKADECTGTLSYTCGSISTSSSAICVALGCTAPNGNVCQGSTNKTTCGGTTGISSPAACNTSGTGCIWSVTADADNNAFVETLCNALKVVTGNGGKAFAAFAVISVGIGFFTGKVSWGLMIGITAGIAAMFGAPTIVAAIAGGKAVDCSAQ